MTKLLLALVGVVGLSVLLQFVFPGLQTRMRFARTATRLSLLPKSEYITASRVPLGSYGKGALIADYVIVSQYGVFVIQEKPYNGRVFGKQDEARWTRVSFRQEQAFRNPLFRSRAQIDALEGLLELDRSVFIPIVVFSGGASSWAETSVDIIPGYQLRKTILSYREPRLSYDEVQNSAIRVSGQSE